MANHTITAAYNEALRKLQTSDPAHADVFNPLFELLINNDAFMKALVEKLIKEHKHSGKDGDGAKIPFDNIDVPLNDGGLLTGKDLAYHINERNPHGTRASDVGAASSQKFDEHLINELPHQFTGTNNKKYKYGFKANSQMDGLIFVCEEV